jgi:hypothetical protein
MRNRLVQGKNRGVFGKCCEGVVGNCGVGTERGLSNERDCLKTVFILVSAEDTSEGL